VPLPRGTGHTVAPCFRRGRLAVAGSWRWPLSRKLIRKLGPDRTALLENSVILGIALIRSKRGDQRLAGHFFERSDPGTVHGRRGRVVT
jgi:hypothetical protein